MQLSLTQIPSVVVVILRHTTFFSPPLFTAHSIVAATEKGRLVLAMAGVSHPSGAIVGEHNRFRMK
jgi:hypothetical protein